MSPAPGRRCRSARVSHTSLSRRITGIPQDSSATGRQPETPYKLHRSRARRQCDRSSKKWSGREDLNLRPHRPERCALPDCATPRRSPEYRPPGSPTQTNSVPDSAAHSVRRRLPSPQPANDQLITTMRLHPRQRPHGRMVHRLRRHHHRNPNSFAVRPVSLDSQRPLRDASMASIVHTMACAPGPNRATTG